MLLVLFGIACFIAETEGLNKCYHKPLDSSAITIKTCPDAYACVRDIKHGKYSYDCETDRNECGRGDRDHGENEDMREGENCNTISVNSDVRCCCRNKNMCNKMEMGDLKCFQGTDEDGVHALDCPSIEALVAAKLAKGEMHDYNIIVHYLNGYALCSNTTLANKKNIFGCTVRSNKEVIPQDSTRQCTKEADGSSTCYCRGPNCNSERGEFEGEKAQRVKEHVPLLAMLILVCILVIIAVMAFIYCVFRSMMAMRAVDNEVSLREMQQRDDRDGPGRGPSPRKSFSPYDVGPSPADAGPSPADQGPSPADQGPSPSGPPGASGTTTSTESH